MSGNPSLFDEYKLAVLKNLKEKKMAFGPHQKAAFEEVVVRELGNLRAENAELRKLVREAHDRGFMSAIEDNDEFVSWWKWSAQHPILKEKE